VAVKGLFPRQKDNFAIIVLSMETEKNLNKTQSRRENIFNWLLGSEFLISIIVLVLAGAGYIFLK